MNNIARVVGVTILRCAANRQSDRISVKRERERRKKKEKENHTNRSTSVNGFVQKRIRTREDNRQPIF
jgi:hypothetical protein